MIRARDLPPAVRAGLLKARGRTVQRIPGIMNKTEARFAEHLEAQRRGGQVLRWWFEPLKLRLATKTSYCPDYLALMPDGAVHLWEVKGAKTVAGADGRRRVVAYWTEDSRIKIKLAAELFPLFHFRATWEAGGVWQVEEFEGPG